MDTPTACLEIDLHRLELRYAFARLIEPRAVRELATSIERCGQVIPCIAVTAQDGERWVLIDGYRRIAALKQLGRDTAQVERWACDLAHALIAVLSRAHGRPFQAIEEALLIRELVQGFGVSQHELARRCGRDVSWVCRRLQLISALSDATLAAVRAGHLSAWAATRVLLPLARANAEHADKLLTGLAAAPLTTREWRDWFDHYQRATHEARERLVAHPRLFLDALSESQAQRAIDRLRLGCEGEWLADIRKLDALIARLKKRLPALATETLGGDLANALTHLAMSLQTFHDDITRYCNHDCRRDQNHRAHAASAGPNAARDQPAA
jgi:ParB family chromosome partitioning protein